MAKTQCKHYNDCKSYTCVRGGRRLGTWGSNSGS